MSKKNIIVALIILLAVGGFFFLGRPENKKEGQPNYNRQVSSVKNESECGDNDNCLADVALAKKDPVICSKIGSESDQGECYYEVAVAKQDESICSKMLETYSLEMRNRSLSVLCYSEVAKLKQDESICEKYLDKGADDECYLAVAKLKQDPSVCAKINPTSPYWQDCYRDVGLSKQDPSVCDIITDLWKKDACYYGIFKATHDTSLCGGLEVKDHIEECRRFVK